MDTTKEKQIQLYLAVAIAIAFVAFFVAYGSGCAVNSADVKEKSEQTVQQAEEADVQNESLFVGCNGFF